MSSNIVLICIGLLVGIAASFAGLGGGFLMVPLMLLMGYNHEKAVGTSFVAILIISVSALLAHSKLAHVDWRMGLFLGIGGLIGAQVGSSLVDYVSTAQFRKLFAFILIALGTYIFFKG